MSVKTQTFIELCLEGEVDPESIDDYIDVWHESADIKIELHEFLGFTEEEYDLWIEDPDYLELILYSRRFNKPLSDVVKERRTGLAARCGSEKELNRLTKWLQHKGMI